MMAISIEDFANRLCEIMPVVMKEFARFHTKELYRSKLTLPQLFVLEVIHSREEIKMKDLASYMSVSTPAITGIIERLVRDKYVKRLYDDSDRRVIRVKLTLQAEHMLKHINALRKQIVVKMFDKIKDSDRQNYLRILTQIKDNLIKESNV